MKMNDKAIVLSAIIAILMCFSLALLVVDNKLADQLNSSTEALTNIQNQNAYLIVKVNEAYDLYGKLYAMYNDLNSKYSVLGNQYIYLYEQWQKLQIKDEGLGGLNGVYMPGDGKVYDSKTNEELSIEKNYMPLAPSWADWSTTEAGIKWNLEQLAKR